MASSKPELALHELLKEAFGVCHHDYLVPDARLAGKHLIRVDCYLPALHLVVEFDGHYWHKKRKKADTRKAKVLLKAGYKVLRLREMKGEETLPHLEIEDENFLQLPIASGDLTEVVATLQKVFMKPKEDE